MSNFFCLQLRLCKIFDKFQVWMNISWLTLDWHNYLCAIVSISFFQTMTFSSWNRSDTLFFLLLWKVFIRNSSFSIKLTSIVNYIIEFFLLPVSQMMFAKLEPKMELVILKLSVLKEMEKNQVAVPVDLEFVVSVST